MERKARLALKNGKFETSSARSALMARVRGTGNKTTEVRFRMALARAGIKGWKLHPKGLLGNPDFIFPDAMLAVFVDGCFWHACPRCGHRPKSHASFWGAKLQSTMQRDAVNSAALETRGYEVLRLWEHQLRDDLEGSVQHTVALVARRRSSTRKVK